MPKRNQSKHRQKQLKLEKQASHRTRLNDNTWDALLLNSFNFQYDDNGKFVRKPLEFFQTIALNQENETSTTEKSIHVCKPGYPAKENENSDEDEDDNDNNDNDKDNKKSRRRNSLDVIEQLTSKMAQQEHRPYNELKLFAPLSVIQKMISPSVGWYFTYFHTKIYVVAVLSLFSIAFQIYALHEIAAENSVSMLEMILHHSIYDWTTPLNFPKSILPVWIAYMCLNIVGCLLVPFIYKRWVHKIQDTSNPESRYYDKNSLDEPHRGKYGTTEAVDLVIVPPLDIIYNGHQVDAETDTKLPRVLRSIQPPIQNATPFLEQNNEHLEDQVEFAHHAEYVDENTVQELKTEEKWKRMKRYFGRFASWSFYLILLASYALTQYYANVLFANYDTQLSFSIALSILLVLFNWLCNILAQIATGWEGYIDKASIAKSYFFKTALFLICSRIMLYSFRMFTYFNETGCPFPQLAQQYAIAVPTDIVSTFASSIGLVYIQRFMVDRLCRKSRDTDNKYMPDLVLAEQLDTLLDHTFVLLCGSAVFILMPVGIFIMLCGEWLFVRYKIKHLIRPIVKTNNTFIHLIIAVTLMYVMVAAFVPPIGLAWIFYGFETNCSGMVINLNLIS